MRAYSGVEKYAFVSYSHCDSQKVIEILDKLALAGTRIWYDEGIAPSNDYISVIAKKIEDCAFFIAFISKNSIASQYCSDEIRYAYEEGKALMVIRLDDAELPAWMKMILNRYQSHGVSSVEKADTTAKIILPSIPATVKEQKGIQLHSNEDFTYYLQPLETLLSNQCGYRIVAYSNICNEQFTILEKRLPYGSEYNIYCVMNSKSVNSLEFVLDVVWDFTFARRMPEDDYFMTRFYYKINSNDAQSLPEIIEKIIYRESYTTGEKIFYNYVEGKGTIVKQDGTRSVDSVSQFDPLKLRYD